MSEKKRKFITTKLIHAHRSGNNNNQITKRKNLEPFRITDGVMKIGKYKGKKLSQIPREYLQWMIKEMDLSPSRVSAIKDILK